MFGIHATSSEIVQYVGVFGILVLVVLVARIGNNLEALLKSRQEEAK